MGSEGEESTTTNTNMVHPGFPVGGFAGDSPTTDTNMTFSGFPVEGLQGEDSRGSHQPLIQTWYTQDFL